MYIYIYTCIYIYEKKLVAHRVLELESLRSTRTSCAQVYALSLGHSRRIGNIKEITWLYSFSFLLSYIFYI